jgi:hypothetical protein
LKVDFEAGTGIILFSRLSQKSAKMAKVICFI